MKRQLLSVLVGAALAVAPAAVFAQAKKDAPKAGAKGRRVGQAFGRQSEDRCPHRFVRAVFGSVRRGRGARREDGDRGFPGDGKGQEFPDRARFGRPPEQGRRRVEQGARMVRARPGGHDHRSRHDLHRARGDAGGEGKEPHHHRQRGGVDADHRQAMHRHQRALYVRYVRARQRHRQGGGQAGRRHLVLPDRRLRVRPGAREGHHRGGARQRRQGAGLGAPSVPGHRFLVVPAQRRRRRAPR